ncbi:MAG: hypothetical protein AAF840_18610, partial [Bacteroidota bacterium]
MRKYLFTLCFSLLALPLLAQLRFQDQLSWSEAPEIIRWGATKHVLWSFTSADLGEDAGAK